MIKITKLFSGFRAKITIVLIFSMLFVGALSNFLIYKYALDFQFQQLRDKLMAISRTAALLIDADALIQVPLKKEGINSAQYKTIAKQLLEVKEVNPSIAYIYTMAKTSKPTIFQFVVDPEPEPEAEEEASAYPGDEYDASRFPQMVKAFNGPSADNQMQRDEWGVFLSGYAPIRNTKGEAVAILGVDMEASDVYGVQQQVKARALVVLIVGILLSVILGMVISSRVAKPIKDLVKGTRYIASGHLDYNVEVKGKDEIAELGNAFNKMSTDLGVYIEELKRTTAEKQRLLKELEIAKGIQQSFLPSSVPKFKGLEVAATSLPARMVGGDFYDFIPIEKDKWGLVVADVSGKGIPAALFMALSRTLIRATTRAKLSIVDSIIQANRFIVEDGRVNMFVTLFYAVLDAKKMTLQYVNAGHNPPLLLKSSGSDITLLEAQGIPLGVFTDIDISVDEISLKKGDLVTLYTDGITEAINEEKEQFQVERLSNVVRKNRNLSAKHIMEKIQEELDTFVGTQSQFDDITLMILKAT